MLESKLLRGNIDFVVEQLKRRNFTFDVDEFNKLEDHRKVIQVQTQELQNLRNTKSKAIGQAKASGEDIKPLLDEVSSLGESLDGAKSELNALQFQIDEIAMAIPNLPHPKFLSCDQNTCGMGIPCQAIPFENLFSKSLIFYPFQSFLALSLYRRCRSQANRHTHSYYQRMIYRSYESMMSFLFFNNF